MRTPSVSIILPTYNSIHFLNERVNTILNQTYPNWECIVIDGFSDDGTWEYLSNISKSDERFTLYQFPADGIYEAWNKGVAKSIGEYIYIATSDDTMEMTFLEEMRMLLSNNPECDLAVSRLKIIDACGKPSNKMQWNKFPAQQFYKAFLNTKHKRIAPLDGLLHFGLHTIYHSITQLFIRASLFTRIGLFQTKYGSYGDFAWGMKAGLTSNVIYSPDTYATWRIHENQATELDLWNSSHSRIQLVNMVNSVLDSNEFKFKNEVIRKKDSLLQFYNYEVFDLSIKEKKYVQAFWLVLRYPGFLLTLVSKKKRRYYNSINKRIRMISCFFRISLEKLIVPLK